VRQARDRWILAARRIGGEAARTEIRAFYLGQSLNDLPGSAYNGRALHGLVEKEIMDERQLQIERRSSHQGSLAEFRPAASWGLELGGTHEHDLLLAEGHFRCPHCRRADINEMNVAPRRMR
jgi:hypothetical protein